MVAIWEWVGGLGGRGGSVAGTESGCREESGAAGRLDSGSIPIFRGIGDSRGHN
jgi:hypothetical protein